MFDAVVDSFRKCPSCDAEDGGVENRRDCGCVRAVVVGKYPDARTARLVAMAKARRKGTTLQGRMVGTWTVEAPDAIIEAGGVPVIGRNHEKIIV